MKRVIIIGAGASGLSCMNVLSETNQFDIIMLEQSSKPARKILASGNGRCNISNLDMKIDYYNQNHPYIQNIISNFNVEEFFKKLQLKLRYENNLIYPYSLSSLSVKNALMKSMDTVSYIEDCQVHDLKKDREWIVYTNQGVFTCDYVVVASGSPANNLSGNNNLKMIQSLKIKTNPFTPSLVQVKTKPVYPQLKGQRVKVKATLYDGNKVIDTKVGEVLFTDYGLSGICIMQLSRYIKDLNKPRISLNLLPDLKKEEYMYYLEDGLFHEKVATLLKNKSLNPYAMTFNVTSLMSIDKAQVCHGGVLLDEVDENLQVKKYPGLYVVGEALDVDGDCGGYNLHFAFGSGYHVAKAIIGGKTC